MPEGGMTGGDRLSAKLQAIAGKIPAGQMTVKVGFLEGDTSIAAVAAIQEWGATINREPSEVTVYRKVNKAGTAFLRNGRFVKKAESNFASTHHVGSYTIKIPPRPFFRYMIADNSRQWPIDIAKLLKAQDYDARKVLSLMGERITAQLKESILKFTTPANAKSTIARKGFDKPLIDTGTMYRSVDYEVS